MGILDNREPMCLASRTHPKLGRTINSCVFFPTKWPLSRFVPTLGHQKNEFFSILPQYLALGCLAICGKHLPEPGNVRFFELFYICGSIGRVCPKSWIGISDSDG